MSKFKLTSFFETGIYLIVAVLLVLLFFTAFRVYSKLSVVANSKTEESMYVSRSSLVKEIASISVQAENETYQFIYADSETAFHNFKELKRKAMRLTSRLNQYRSKNKAFQFDAKKVDQLIEKRFQLLEKIMGLGNESRVNNAMDRVMQEVKTKNKSTVITVPIEEKKGFFRKKKTTIQTIVVPANAYNVNEKLAEIKKEVVSDEVNYTQQKLQLEEANNAVSQQLNVAFQRIEQLDKKELLSKNKQAQIIASQTNVVIVQFSIVAASLIAMMVVLFLYQINISEEVKRTLRLAKKKSDDLTETKSRFLAVMSHEIRTPMNAISGFSNQLMNTTLPSEASEKASMIYQSALHLTEITNDLLELSKLEKKKTDLLLAPFSLKSEIQLVINQFSDAAKRKGNIIEWSMEQHPWVLSDALRFRQIFINLISNANKFTQQGTIRWSVIAPQSDDNLWVFTIADSGIGMSDEQMERIFKPFEQADAKTYNEFGGTGLGLSITAELVKLFGGAIAVESEQGKGTVFTISIPLATIAAVDELTISETLDFSFLANKKVLLVDDESFNLKLLKSILNTEHLSFFEASNGKAALKVLENVLPDVILLDFQMPEMDGHSLKEALNRDPKWKEIPVVGLTATLTEAEREVNKSNGWFECLVKPIDAAVLHRALSAVFAVSHDSLQYIDLSDLRRLSAGNSGFMVDMLATFIETSQRELALLQKAVNTRDLKQIVFIAHKLATPYKHMGAASCYGLLKKMEHCEDWKDENEIIAVFSEFAKTTEIVFDQVRSAIAADN